MRLTILCTAIASVIDFHCHLDLYQQSDEFSSWLRNAKFIFAVTTTPLALQGNKDRFGTFKNVRVGCGLHPELVAQRHTELPLLLDQISDEDLVGEIGLDGCKVNKSSYGLQLKVFSAVVRTCGEKGGKLVSIHSRNAVSAIIDVLEQNRPIGFPIFHWFAGTEIQARRISKLGGYFSVNAGASESSTAWLSAVPRHLILPETDGPFQKQNGRQLWPGEVDSVSRIVARVWGIPLSDATEQLTENARGLLRRTGLYKRSRAQDTAHITSDQSP